MHHLVVVSGGGSPYNETYKQVYDFIQAEGRHREWTCEVIDFVGCGHLGPTGEEEDYGRGFEVSAAADRVTARLAEIDVE